MTEADRYDTNRPNLCAALRWKGLFIGVEYDSTAQQSSSGYFWCLHTQNCLGPDGKIAEPGDCDSTKRGCHKLELTLA